MSDGRILVLYLDAPLQSWGHSSRFDRRTTLSYPTRSGVLGMICAALGVDRTDADELERLNHGLRMTVCAFERGDRRSGLLVDYHTVGGGYDKKTERQNIVRKADGKTGDTVVTRREYLQDARFGVLLEGETALLERIVAALVDPVWGIWLGRKSCIPATPVVQGVFESSASARAHLERLAGGAVVRTISEVTDFDAGTDSLSDVPLDYGARRYAMRRIVDEPG